MNVYEKSRNKRSDQLATRETAYAFDILSGAKNRRYKQNTNIQKVELKTLYFNFD